jgi:hypothetical protein
MKVLHNVNTMKREQLYLQKVNINLFINLVIIQNVTSRLHAIVQVVKKEPNYQKQNGHGNLVLTPRVTSEVTSYQDTCYPNLSPLKISLPAS